jgi:hypothetical protein
LKFTSIFQLEKRWGFLSLLFRDESNFVFRSVEGQTPELAVEVDRPVKIEVGQVETFLQTNFVPDFKNEMAVDFVLKDFIVKVYLKATLYCYFFMDNNRKKWGNDHLIEFHLTESVDRKFLII